MIRLENVTFSHQGAKSRRKVRVLDDVSANLPTDRRLIILGHRGSGKSTLIRLLCGGFVPDTGSITRTVKVSYPVGFAGGFEAKLSVRKNIEFACDLHDADSAVVLAFVSQVTGLVDSLDRPLGSLDRTARAKLAFTLSYAIPFDTYLIDAMPGGGGREFRDRCLQMLDARLQTGGMIMATSEARLAERLGDSAAILYRGKLYVYDNVQAAVETYRALDPPLVPEHAPSGQTEDED